NPNSEAVDTVSPDDWSGDGRYGGTFPRLQARRLSRDETFSELRRRHINDQNHFCNAVFPAHMVGGRDRFIRPLWLDWRCDGACDYSVLWVPRNPLLRRAGQIYRRNARFVVLFDA